MKLLTAPAAAFAFAFVIFLARDGLPGDPRPGQLPEYAYPAGTRTGDATVDRVLDAIEAPAPDALRSLFVETPAPCVINPRGITNPPLCPEGVAAGTLVPVFRATSCESVWPDYLETALSQGLWRWPRPVLAVYRGVPARYGWLPAADSAVVVRSGPPGDGWSAVIRLSGDAVNGIAFDCGGGLAHHLEGVAPGQFVLPPLREPPGPRLEPPAAPKDVRPGLIVCITTPCPGYFVEWRDASSGEDGFAIYWRNACSAGPTAPFDRPLLIAKAPANAIRAEELVLPSVDCTDAIGVAAFNAAGQSAITWGRLR